MHTIAFLTQKGGAGKTTLAASLAVAAAGAGEKVIALDLDSQGSLARWAERRKAANAANAVVVDDVAPGTTVVGAPARPTDVGAEAAAPGGDGEIA